jgi:prostaglandin-E synthase 1
MGLLDALTGRISALPGFALLSVCASLLILKMYALAGFVAARRRKARVAVNPEDVRGDTRLADVEPAEVARINRALRNDTENVPAFLVVALLAVHAPNRRECWRRAS